MRVDNFPWRAVFKATSLALMAAVLLSSSLLAQAEKRPLWTTSRIEGSLEPPSPFRLERAFPQLKFDRPVELVAVPGGERMLMIELEGRITSFPNNDRATKAELVIDLKPHVEGLERAYSLAFHPQVAENHYCYISYVLKPELEHGTHVSRFKLTQLDPPKIDPQSEEILITWLSGGHNGACLRFGPDGCLYISTGDGGPAFPPDPHKSGQDVSNLLASILRIDVDRRQGELPYAVPDDNPFVKTPGARGEVWCYGHRNPWKMSFDSANGNLWVGDVGWEMWELVYRVTKGGNYGWSVMEGSQRVHYDRPLGPTPILPPTIQHSHIESRSVTGGHVYRGKQHPALQGRYVYGDYVTGKLWAAKLEGQKANVQEIADSALQVITFAVDQQQELYVVDYGGGIFRLAENETTEANRDFPRRLSETGLFKSVADHQVAAGVIPYSIRYQPWEDFAAAERFLAVPGEGQLDIHDNQNPQIGEIKGQWKYPANSVLVKTISMEIERGRAETRRRLETQILHLDGLVWRPYTYVWNEQQTDAELAPASGGELQLQVIDAQAPGGKRQQAWRIPARSECTMCHTARGGVIYGFRAEQLDCDHPYPGGTANQLRQLEQWGLFAKPTPKWTSLAADDDASADLSARARAYLHVNCAHCHRRGGGGTAAIEVMHQLKLDRTHLTERPTQGMFNLLDAHVLAPGDPYRSVAYYRMAKIGRGRMPHFGSQIVDRQGLQLIRDWIAALPAEQDQDQAVARIRRQQARSLQQLRRASSDQAVQSLLTTTSGALQLVSAIDRDELSPDGRRLVIETGGKHSDPRIRDLFEPYLPEDQRTKRLGAVVDRQRLLQLEGDLQRGRELFQMAAGVQCRNCHQVGGRGRQVGPELSDVGKRYTRAQLLETILEPSAKIEPKWVTYTVLTSGGQIHSGLVMQRDGKQLTLRNNLGKDVVIEQADIERMTAQQKSLMPELQLSDLTEQQVADLLTFLQAQRGRSER